MIIWCKVGGQNRPVKLLQFLLGHHCDMWPSVIMKEENFSRPWSPLFVFRLESLKLSSIYRSGDCCISGK